MVYTLQCALAVKLAVPRPFGSGIAAWRVMIVTDTIPAYSLACQVASREKARRYSSDPMADLKQRQLDYKDAMAALARRKARKRTRRVHAPSSGVSGLSRTSGCSSRSFNVGAGRRSGLQSRADGL